MRFLLLAFFLAGCSQGRSLIGCTQSYCNTMYTFSRIAESDCIVAAPRLQESSPNYERMYFCTELK